jgi:hypothetical protein
MTFDFQPRTLTSRRAFFRLVTAGCLLAVITGTAACGRKIGDACASSADCDPTSGTRTCDLSQLGGYCLLEGCDARSCPSEAVCVRFFPEALLLQTPTNRCALPVSSTATTGSVDGGADAGTNDDTDGGTMPCSANEVCLACGPGQGCTPGTGTCARLSWEKRDCVLSCGSNADCRGGYICKQTGTGGTIALTLNPDPAAAPKFCAPAPPAN